MQKAVTPRGVEHAAFSNTTTRRLECRRQARKRGTSWNIAREQELVRLREQGLTLTEIGRRVGLSYTSVGNALRRQGRGDLLGGRGFVGLSPERRCELAGWGVKAAQAAGTAHTFSGKEVRVAGAKGGKAAHAKGTAHVFTPEQARVAGRKGGRAGAGDRPARGRSGTSAGRGGAARARSAGGAGAAGGNGRAVGGGADAAGDRGSGRREPAGGGGRAGQGRGGGRRAAARRRHYEGPPWRLS